MIKYFFIILLFIFPNIVFGATRLYLSNSAVDVSLPAVQGTWTDSSNSTTSVLGDKAGAATTVSFTSTATGQTNMLARWQSYPITSNTSFSTSDSVNYVVGAVASNNTSTSWNFRTHIFVVKPDGTVRGTLLDNFTGSETLITTTAAGRSDGSQGLSNNVSALAGDRVVVEIGHRRLGAGAGSKSTTFNYGNTGVTDLTAGSTNVTTEPGWVEFSNTFDTDIGAGPESSAAVNYQSVIWFD